MHGRARILLIVNFDPFVVIVYYYMYTHTANIDYVQREVMVSLSDSNPFEELLIPTIDDNEYEGLRDEIFFVQAQLNPNGQNSERVQIAADLVNVTVNIIDNDPKPGTTSIINYR